MKLTITKSELNRGLSRIQAIVEKRNSMPILANALLEARLPEDGEETGTLELAATDLEVGIRGVHPARVETAGSLTISAKKLFEITRELPDEAIHLAHQADQMVRRDHRCGVILHPIAVGHLEAVGTQSYFQGGH